MEEQTQKTQRSKLAAATHHTMRWVLIPLFSVIVVWLLVWLFMQWQQLMWNSPVPSAEAPVYLEVPEARLTPEERIAWAASLTDAQRGKILAPMIVNQMRHYVERVGWRSNDLWLIYKRDAACESGYEEPGGVWLPTVAALNAYAQSIARFGPGNSDDPNLTRAVAQLKARVDAFGVFGMFDSVDEYEIGFDEFDTFMRRLAGEESPPAKNSADETDIVALLASVFGDDAPLDLLYSRAAEVENVEGRRSQVMRTYSLVCGAAVAADLIRGVKVAYAHYFKPNALKLLDVAEERFEHVAQMNIPIVMQFDEEGLLANHASALNGILGPAFDSVKAAAQSLPRGVEYFK